MDGDGDDGVLAGAQGKFVLFLASLFNRAGVVTTGEFGQLLTIFAETVEESDPGEAAILARWASAIRAIASN